MPRSVRVASVQRGGGRLHVRFSDKRGVLFNSLQDAVAIVDGLEASLTDEALTVLALRKVGLPNAETLEGKTITLSLDVVIS